MEPTNQGIPLGGNPSPFSSWGDVGAPHMATLSLPGLTIGLPVWLFSTNVVQNTTVPEQSSQQLDQTKVSHQPSTSSSSPPSSSLDEAGKAKNQVPEKKKEKKKKEKKKKEPKAKRGNQASSSENPHTAPTRPKLPCVICKGDHYHRDCPCIPQILRDWSPHLHNPVSSTSDGHVENTPSTSESEAPGQKGKYRFPCKLCEGDHAVHHCPFLDEAKRVLDDRLVSPLRLPPGYKKLLPSPSLVENLADPLRWSAEASIIEDKPSEPIPNESQKVEAAVDPVLPSKVPSSDDTVTEENKDDTVQILFVRKESDEHGGSTPIPLPQEGSSSNSHPAIYSVPPPSNLVVSFDWNLLGRPRLPASVPFRIIAQIYRMVMASTIIDEGASVSILSSTAWKALGSPSLLPEMRNLTGFDKGTSRPLGILPKLPITFRKKIIYVNVMVVQGPVDYNLL
ncbi:retropepsin-like aspartic protease, partial [Actinobacillus pleuropneumoniae]